MAKRWVRYVVPVMVEVEVDCNDDKVTRVVTLPEEVREDRDDMRHFLIEKFVRRDGDEQPQVHAFCVGEPRWADHRFRVGGPANWPERWAESFSREAADDRYEEINPYELRER